VPQTQKHATHNDASRMWWQTERQAKIDLTLNEQQSQKKIQIQILICSDTDTLALPSWDTCGIILHLKCVQLSW